MTASAPMRLEEILDRIAWSAYRPGQRTGLRLGVEHMLNREPFTSFSIATRYGKSPLIRSLALIGKAASLIQCSIALSPNETLRNQLNLQKHWESDLNRFALRSLLPGRRLNVRTWATGFPVGAGHPTLTPEGEWFVGATAQLAHVNQRWLELWVESELHKTGLPIAVFADEVHMDGAGLPWGDLLTTLAKAGALVFPFTATPERADGRSIPGFRKEVKNTDPVIVSKRRPGRTPELVKVEIWEGERQIVQLRADVEVSFEEAWGETPSPLCEISYIPFDVRLRELGAGPDESLSLSELSDTEARQQLGRVVRRSDVIRKGVDTAVFWLNHIRRAKPDAALIIFCQPDLQGDDERHLNQHIKEVQAALVEFAPDLEVLVATSANQDKRGVDVIQDFRDRGRGDVLIVKMMAGLGLDCPRAKVGLDLAAVRQYASYVQRLTRIATPYDGWLHAVWITPADVVGQALFQRCVADKGGEFTETLLLDKVKEYERVKLEQTSKTYVTDGTTDAEATDNRARLADVDSQPAGRALAGMLPAILQMYTFPQICEAAAALHVDPTGVAEPVQIRDTLTENRRLRRDLDAKATDIASERCMRQCGHYDPKEYQELIRDVWLRAKRTVGYRDVVSDETPLNVLRALDIALDELWAQVSRGNL